VDGPGIESQWEGDIFRAVQSGSEDHTASYTKGTESFPGVKRDVSHQPTSTAAVVSGLELHLRLLSVPV
jgi:hypothetical protein